MCMAYFVYCSLHKATKKNVFKKTRGTIPANILNYNITELCGAGIAETLFKFYFHSFIIKPQPLLIRFTIRNILQSKIALDFIFRSFAHLQFVNMIFFSVLQFSFTRWLYKKLFYM